jgi:hypothetical protein
MLAAPKPNESHQTEAPPYQRPRDGHHNERSTLYPNRLLESSPNIGFKPDFNSNFEAVHDQAQLVESFAISIREAAFRRDEVGLRLYRAPFREAVKALMGGLRNAAPIQGAN